MDDERRGQYRVKPTGEDALRMTLHESHVDTVSDEVVDLSIHGAGIRFRRDGRTPLDKGDRVVLTLASPKLDRTLDIVATIASRTDHEDHLYYTFHFDDGTRLERELPDAFYRLFNRRGAFRANVSDDAALEVWPIEPAPDGEPPHRPLRLKDISTTGLAAVADSEVGSLLDDVDVVGVLLKLPEREHMIELAARIRNRECKDDVFYYGLMFDPARTENFLEQAEEIVDFVVERYTKHLRFDLR